MKHIMVICAALALAACTTDDDATATDEQALGGLAVSVGCDSGGYSLLCVATVTGGTAPYTYQWHPGADITGPVTELPKAPQTAHAPCGPVNRQSGLWVTVIDSAGGNASGSGSTICEVEW